MSGHHNERQCLFSPDLELYFEDSEHSRKIESLYTVGTPRPSEALRSALADTTVVFVCFSNRSGSNLLLDILERLGFGAAPGDEFFNDQTVQNFYDEFGFLSFEEYLAFIADTRKKSSSLFLKIGPHQLFWLANRGLINAYFPNAKYLVTHRR